MNGGDGGLLVGLGVIASTIVGVGVALRRRAA
jgi:hypothetical protein